MQNTTDFISKLQQKESIDKFIIDSNIDSKLMKYFETCFIAITLQHIPDLKYTISHDNENIQQGGKLVNKQIDILLKRYAGYRDSLFDNIANEYQLIFSDTSLKLLRPIKNIVFNQKYIDFLKSEYDFGLTNGCMLIFSSRNIDIDIYKDVIDDGTDLLLNQAPDKKYDNIVILFSLRHTILTKELGNVISIIVNVINNNLNKNGNIAIKLNFYPYVDQVMELVNLFQHVATKIHLIYRKELFRTGNKCLFLLQNKVNDIVIPKNNMPVYITIPIDKTINNIIDNNGEQINKFMEDVFGYCIDQLKLINYLYMARMYEPDTYNHLIKKILLFMPIYKSL
jgi:hypothetical protein